MIDAEKSALSDEEILLLAKDRFFDLYEPEETSLLP